MLLPIENEFYMFEFYIIICSLCSVYSALINIIFLLCEAFHNIRKEFGLFAMIQKSYTDLHHCVSGLETSIKSHLWSLTMALIRKSASSLVEIPGGKQKVKESSAK